MARFDYRKLSKEKREEIIDELVSVMSAVKTKEDLQTFFLQLVTPSEAVMLGRRWQIAKRLAAGKSYYSVAEELKVGMSTIQSVDQWLSESIGDYRERLEEEKARLRRKRVKQYHLDVPESFYSLRHRYAGAFLLINLLLDAIEKARIEEWHEKSNRSGKKTTKRK